jgi:FAD/FMN-containing dehydrogenase
VAIAQGGKMVVRKWPAGVALSPAEVWGAPRPEVAVMRAIKERFDPQNILNPGRFIFD